jgi:hypothetical protein
MRSVQVVAFLMRARPPNVYNPAGSSEAWSSDVDHSQPRS